MTDIHSFSDFAEPRFGLSGVKRRISDILDTPLVALAYKIIPSKKNSGECLQLQFTINNEKFIVFTGSAVLIDQCKTYTEKFPFNAKIQKIDRYFSFV
ncbi:MAG: hypothetical protein LBL75_02060 [Rickettsiales bacterium]|jgi:hypothetical protein|nr:hypothetical protein [Rickettsiales bacterium]